MSNNESQCEKLLHSFELAKQFGATPQIDITLTDSVDGDTAITEQLQVDGELLENYFKRPEYTFICRERSAKFWQSGKR
ncbi:MAG: hypothetical protein IPM91_19780 [Bacteroidetes bacterium]|nr:hypothetical protein [Bacteroidota bacterium]